MWRLDILEQIAARKVASLVAQRPDFIEEVEVFLGFQTMLANELQLPGASRVMLYPKYSEITADDLAQARSEISEVDTDPQCVDLMANWEPWQETLKGMHPVERRDMLIDTDYMREITRIQTILPLWFEERTAEFVAKTRDK